LIAASVYKVRGRDVMLEVCKVKLMIMQDKRNFLVQKSFYGYTKVHEDSFYTKKSVFHSSVNLASQKLSSL
jgi:hypothetical protein